MPKAAAGTADARGPASFYFLVVPVSGGHVVTFDSDGNRWEGELAPVTLLAASGPRAYILLVLPVLFATISLFAGYAPSPRIVRWTSAGLLSASCFSA